MAVEVLPVTQPADPPYLDHHFQDWLAGDTIGLMRRSPKVGELLQAELPRLIDQRSRGGKILLREGELLEVLLREQGYMVSKVQAAKALYNGFADPVELRAIDATCQRLRRHLQNPELFYRKLGVGMGVGLTDFKLSWQQLQLLFSLWQHSNQWIESDQLGVHIWNTNDGWVCRENTISVGICRLRRRLVQSGVKIETHRRNPYQEVAWKLVEG